MSVQALAAVFEYSEATLGSRLVLIAIANYANEHGENAFPSIETIGRDARMSVRQVIRCVQDLEARQEITVERSFNKPNRYRINLPGLNPRSDNLSPLEQTPSLTTKYLGSRDISGPDLSRDKLSPLADSLCPECQTKNPIGTRACAWCGVVFA